nr:MULTISPECIES: outer membrane usher protein [unclassified Serratia (in: enterobacteria)]
MLCQAGLGSTLLLGSVVFAHADDIQFNSDILDLKDRSNIDLSQFAQKGFILPGSYSLAVSLNTQVWPEQSVDFIAPENDPKGSQVCLTPALVAQMGLTDKALSELTWWHQEQCLNVESLKGMEVRTDLGTSTLYLSMPHAYLEYSSPDWDPPARWEEGIPGILLDYNVNMQNQQQTRGGGGSGTRVSGNGTTGANLGVWRLRADWQARYDSRSQGRGESRSGGNGVNLDWSRYYAYRALPAWGAKLTLGEDYLNSSIFDSFRFTGASLVSDDNMLPPNLRGYAPEVSGVARRNAKVVISQQGRIIKEVQVAAGPFRIQDLDSAVSGRLDVRVEEQDGSVQRFQVDTATIPYLTRPGQVRFKTTAGRASDWNHRVNGPTFASGEFSWGVSNGWSLYGGGLAGGDYAAASLGIGRDLLALGALSADVTQSRARLPGEGNQTGGSYRLSYSKRFVEIGSQVTFAGYRFSDSTFMSMSEYLQARDTGIRQGRNKEMYTVSFNQSFESLGLSTYLNYSHQSYWDKSTTERYDLTASRNFDVGRFRNVSLSLTAYRNRFNKTDDDGMYMSLSLPFGGSGRVSYNGSYSSGDTRNSVGYYDRLKNGDTYQVSAGTARTGADLSGYYARRGSQVDINASASYREGQYSAVGLSANGGATLTREGGALHRSGLMGGTRMLIDTDGVAGVPVGANGNPVYSNRFGKAVVADVTSYYRNSVRIDIDKLADNAEVPRSVVQSTLTEGAIGYRKFEVISGEKAMAVILLADGSVPPFGASVLNQKKQDAGIVSDSGHVYLSGIRPNEKMAVNWNGSVQCHVTLPAVIPTGMTTNLMLPCVKEAALLND